jgi:hypothetical protein
MRDVCPYIQTQSPENHPDRLDIRCPIEVELWYKGFDNYTGYVYSMDPEGEPPTEFELAICKDISWMLVEEHRVLLSLADSPDPVVDSVVPGTDGMTAEQVNQRNITLSTVRKDINRAVDRLTKAVERRLENVKDQKEHYIRTIEAMQAEIHKNPEKYEGTRLGGVVNTLAQRIEKNQLARKQAEEEKIG